MRIIDRYLIRGFAKALCFCLLFFCLTFIVIDVFNNLDELLKNAVAPDVIAGYYFYLLPSMIVQILPISVLVALIFTLGNLNRHNEIIAMKAGGVSALHILAPYVFAGIALSFGILLLNETVVPRFAVSSQAIRNSLIEHGKKDLSERSIQNVTHYGKNHRMVFAREFEVLSNTLYDVVILEDNPNKTLKSKLTAQKASYENGRWVLEKTVRYGLNRRGDLIADPSYADRLELEMEEKPEDFIREASQVEFMNTRELKDYIAHLEGSSRRVVRRLLVDFHYKIAFPFVTLVVMLIGAPLAMKTERGSAMRGIGTSLVIVVLYYAVESVCLAMGKNGVLPAVLAAWFSNVLFATVGLYLIRNTS